MRVWVNSTTGWVQHGDERKSLERAQQVAQILASRLGWETAAGSDPPAPTDPGADAPTADVARTSPAPSKPAPRGSWSAFLESIRRVADPDAVERDEIAYKSRIAGRMAEARDAAVTGSPTWQGSLKAALTRENNLINFRSSGSFLNWCGEHPDEALRALRLCWSDAASPDERIRSFLAAVPKEAIRGPSARLDLASLLLMGVSASEFPHVRQTVFNAAFDEAGYPRPPDLSDEAGFYLHALRFLDELQTRAVAEGITVPDRLWAQSLVWRAVVLWDELGPAAEPAGTGRAASSDGVTRPATPAGESLESVAESLFLPADFLRRIDRLIRDKRQVIFYGPPGTGKTYVARRLAEFYGGSRDAHIIVQFHPSYAYEDFVEGFRPRSDGGDGFVLTPGPLLELAQRAATAPDTPHVLVIDELNRGNVAKVFGELYFALEYRSEPIRLQYSRDASFSLPPNLWIIGTMNSADRSIALLDGALRRRFHFVEFSPHREPVRGLLARWLAANQPDYGWVAALLDRTNLKLADRHAAIGPSYFMRPGLDESWVQLTWDHQILPYLEEQLYGREDLLEEFSLAALRGGAEVESAAPEGE